MHWMVRLWTQRLWKTLEERQVEETRHKCSSNNSGEARRKRGIGQQWSVMSLALSHFCGGIFKRILFDELLLFIFLFCSTLLHFNLFQRFAPWFLFPLSPACLKSWRPHEHHHHQQQQDCGGRDGHYKSIQVQSTLQSRIYRLRQSSSWRKKLIEPAVQSDGLKAGSDR